MHQVYLKNTDISKKNFPYIIAEIGVNHEGSVAKAKHLIDLAASAQKVTENVIFHMLKSLHAKTRLDNICITGGVAQNSVANGKIIENTPFKNIYIINTIYLFSKF